MAPGTASTTETAANTAQKAASNPGLFRRLLELMLLLCTTLAALFFFKEAEEAAGEKLRLEEELRRVKKARADAGDGDSTGGKCSVCLDNPLELALEPCGHVCLCRDCGVKVVRCPICRGVIDDKRDVFLAT